MAENLFVHHYSAIGISAVQYKKRWTSFLCVVIRRKTCFVIPQKSGRMKRAFRRKKCLTPPSRLPDGCAVTPHRVIPGCRCLRGMQSIPLKNKRRVKRRGGRSPPLQKISTDILYGVFLNYSGWNLHHKNRCKNQCTADQVDNGITFSKQQPSPDYGEN